MSAENKGLDKNKTDLIIATEENLVEIYKSTLEVLRETISVGKSCPMIGFTGVRMFADFLHGGAYKGRIADLPYYKTGLPAGASEAQKEVIGDSDVSHMLPKLLSDQAMFWIEDISDRFFLVENVGGLVTTNLRTLVEGGGSLSRARSYRLQSEAALVKATEAAENTE